MTTNIPLLERTQYTPLSLPLFLSEVDSFKTALQTFESALTYLPQLHDEALASTEAPSAGSGSGTGQRLDAAIADFSQQSKGLKDMLKAMERDVLLTERDGEDLGEANAKRAHWKRCKEGLQTALGAFQNTERVYRQRLNDQLSRQYRIINPDATEDEIAGAVASGETQIFSQAILTSNRSASASSVARAVRERQQDIVRIEKALQELLTLFQQLEEAIVLQDPVVENIEHRGDEAARDIERGVQHLETGVVSARGARKKKWICLGIVIAILLVIVIIIVVVTLVKKKE
ncbi:t-SNARE [Ascodesmis nigricans]|uniref:t-SNARE n=1 Tax=Ascodesmis nigricans TaxID=341454 RepID=A0A4S2MV36_9PEZI|nr:t-SNARE [Ascodesmis nigricans]